MEDSFKEYTKNPEILSALKHLGFQTPTPIQKIAIPRIQEGKDILAKAKTGSGKSFAFGIPLLERRPSSLSKLILSPTRELASQLSDSLRQIASFSKDIKIISLYGGTPLRPQAKSLEHGAHIIVGTPGRILDHLEKETLSLDAIDTLVLDEADKMLDMGFLEDVKRIINACKTRKQTLLFSATLSPQVLALSQEFQKSPELLEEQSFQTDIKEYFFSFHKGALEQLLYAFAPKSAIIFCNTKLTCNKVEEQLHKQGFDALALHSGFNQEEREERLILFKQKSCSFLVATDLASRGLDIKGVEAVINYEMPLEESTYIHRIGRSGRMGEKGLALSLCEENLPPYIKTPKTDLNEFKALYKNPFEAEFSTLYINAGKKQKIRKGDIVGAFLQKTPLSSEDIGDITLKQNCSYVAVKREKAQKAYRLLQKEKIKNQKVKLWIL